MVEQIANTITKDIEKGIYKKDERLLSINTYSQQHGVARDTIEKAYGHLIRKGYVVSVKGKGYFVVGKPNTKISVLLLFNRLSSYKKLLYDAIVKTLGSAAMVDLQIYNDDPELLEEYVDMQMGKYHYYIVMPHFNDEEDEQRAISVLKKVPANQLVLLDRDMPGLAKHSAIFQDFENDIYAALKSVPHLLSKYNKVMMIFPPDKSIPREIQSGLKKFCTESDICSEVVSNQLDKAPEKGCAYITLAEADLVQLLKNVKKTDYTLGKDVGVISYNDTDFKELLAITVLTTEFEEMGKTTARMILKNECSTINNPFKIIIRDSL